MTKVGAKKGLFDSNTECDDIIMRLSVEVDGATLLAHFEQQHLQPIKLLAHLGFDSTNSQRNHSQLNVATKSTTNHPVR